MSSKTIIYDENGKITHEVVTVDHSNGGSTTYTNTASLDPVFGNVRSGVTISTVNNHGGKSSPKS
jgi:hypothetical protein